MTGTDGKLESLPKWARERIGMLERNLEHAERRLAEGPESDTYADPYAEPARPLGEGATIRFVLSTLPDGRAWHYVDVRIDRGASDGRARVCIHASDHLAFLPSSSNLGYVKLVRPRDPWFSLTDDRIASHHPIALPLARPGALRRNYLRTVAHAPQDPTRAWLSAPHPLQLPRPCIGLQH